MNNSFYDAWANLEKKQRAEEEKKKAVKAEKEILEKMGATSDQEDTKDFMRMAVEAKQEETKEDNGPKKAFDVKKVKIEKTKSDELPKEVKKGESKGDEKQIKVEKEEHTGPTQEQKDTKDFMRRPVKVEKNNEGLGQVVDIKKTKKEIKDRDKIVFYLKKVKVEKTKSAELTKEKVNAEDVKEVELKTEKPGEEKTAEEGINEDSPMEDESWAHFLKRNGRSMGGLTAEERKKISAEWDDTHGGYFNIRDFAIGRPLGRGRFGRVYVAKDLVNEEHLVALKILFKSSLSRAKCEHLLMREIDVQSKLHHPNILRLFNYFWDENKIYLIMEFAVQGDLYREMSRNHPIEHQKVAKYIYQLADGLKYLHGMNIIHRDIKPENILLGAEGELKIADFGWSVRSENKRETQCGTISYMAPEIMKHTAYDHSVDLWAIGVLLFELLTKKEPFGYGDINNVYKRIVKAEFYCPASIPPKAKELVTSLLKVNPKERMSLVEVMNHPWIRSHLKKGESKKGDYV